MLPRVRSETGQAAVELVALLPLVAVLCLALWQIAILGYAEWAAGGAARAAARAEAVGENPLPAARRALPGALEAGLRVQARPGGGVRLRVGVPLVLGAGRLLSLERAAALPSQRR